MNARLKNILIGLFVTAAFTIAASTLLFLRPHIGDGRHALCVRFTNIAGITVGTRVTFAGKPIGEVLSIREIIHSRTGPADDQGRIYCYELELKIDSHTPIYTTDEISIRGTGLMGERSVAILPKLIPSGEQPQLVRGEILYAVSADSFDNTLNQVFKLATHMDTVIQQVGDIVQEEREPLRQTMGAMQSALSQAASTLTTFQQEEILPSAKQAIDLLNSNLTFIQTGLDQENLLPKASRLLDGLDQLTDLLYRDGGDTLHHLEQISADLASGTGTLGRLISMDDLYLRLTSILGKGETLMNDINHYGLLFQYDKHWQRGRTKRANLLQSLKTPRDFRDYFEGELDIMTTSLSRLTELLETSDREATLSSEDFQRSFSNLLRKVQDLTTFMKVYNEELIAKTTEE